MTNAACSLQLLVVSCAVVACGINDPPLRGKVERSPDGKTYFAVADNNGGGCGAIYVDGKVWPHRIGEIAPIEPGPHTIACPVDAEIGFAVKPGVIFRFNDWGP